MDNKNDEELKSKDSRKKSKSKKRKIHKKEKKRSKKKRKYSDSSSSSDSENDKTCEWVEKVVSNNLNSKDYALISNNSENMLKRDDWMNLDKSFSLVENNTKVKEKRPHKEERTTAITDLPGQSSKELNPHWKNNGTGLPSKNIDRTSTGVMDVGWLKKSLKRAEEQSKEENRTLEEIAEERWGSLDAIHSMIREAENYSRQHHIENKNKNKSYTHQNKRYSMKFQKPRDYSSSQFYPSPKTNQQGSGNWKKEKHKKTNVSDIQEKSTYEQSVSTQESVVAKSEPITISKELNLSEEELNKIGARIIKAEIMGNEELANELKKTLQQAREKLLNTAQSSNSTKEIVKTVITTKQEMKNKKKKAETHVSGERVRYYADDDKYSLEEMFLREKRRTTDDSDASFSKYVTKNMDLDDAFEQKISTVESSTKEDERDCRRLLKEQHTFTKSLENCCFCIDSKFMLKHLIINMNSKICLSLPSHTSLVNGHCILSPIQHIPCEIELDEDVLESLKEYKESLIKFFKTQKQHPVFFEIFKKRHIHHHMNLQVIPLPEDIIDMAPMYFKKALLESETEWSTNKKLIDLNKKDIRQSIPKSLSYFAIYFGNQKGYGHVIEDESIFPNNFAEEIIGGMLDIDHHIWRKPKKENFEQQKQKVLQFSEIWKKHNVMKNI